MPTFPTPTVNDTRDMERIFNFSNEASGGIFFPSILFAIWMIAFIGSISEGRSANRAWIFASFISSILGIVLALLGWLQPSFMYISILMLAFGVLWAKLVKTQERF